jgi:NAD(P)-dependent dehydrogenase (short-subunit alcohol dehydrogenase family)
MDITGASAVVTGGASGIGAACARQLAAKGAKVVIADLNATTGEALAAEIGGAFVAVDVTNTEQILAAVNKALELGPLWVLVNSAGIGWAQRTIGKDGQYESAADLDAFKKVIAINLIGSFDAIRLAATAMSRNTPNENGERGAIVNMASVAAFDGQIGHPREHDRARTHRHPDLRGRRAVRALQSEPRPERALPQAPRRAGRTGLDGDRVHHQLLHERRDDPR